MANTKIIECTLEFKISAEGPGANQTITLSFNSQNTSNPWSAVLKTPMSKSSYYSDETLGGLVRKTGDAPAVQKIVRSLARRQQTVDFAKLTHGLNNNR